MSVRDTNLMSLSDLKVDIFYKLRANLSRNGLPLTVGGVERFGLKNLYNDEKISKVINPTELHELLTTFEKRGIFLSIKEEEFNSLDFRNLNADRGFKESVRNTLYKHGALIYAKEEKARR